MDNLRSKIRSVALTFASPTVGFSFILLLEMYLDVELSKLLSSIVNLVVVALIAFLIFPKWLGIPFGRIDTRGFLRRVGLYLPDGAWKHVILGLSLAGCTLSGMFLASVLTGSYVMDAGTINLPHLVFSLNPALWEELFYRGVMMILLLRYTGSLRRASAIQAVLFGMAHIKGLGAWAFVDVFTVIVISIGFTYAAYKTRSLLAGVTFHYFHDALLKFVQIPSTVDPGVTHRVLFNVFLWVMVGVGCVVTKLAVDRYKVRAPAELYRYEGVKASITHEESKPAVDVR